MTQFIYDHLGIRRKTSDIEATYLLFKLKEKSASNPWPVIEKCIEVWQKKNPAKWESYLIQLRDIKETRKVTTVGSKQFRGVSRNDRKNDGMISYLLDLPQPIMGMIRILYSHQELPMNKEFFAEFAKRFPVFRVREHI